MGKSKRREEGQYLPLPYSQLRSDAWRSLSGSAVRLWLELHARYNGGNNGRFTLSYAEAGEILGMGKATVQRAYAQLVEVGFLALEKEGNWYGRRAHEWRLTTKPMMRSKGRESASNEWRHYRKPKTKRGSGSEPSSDPTVPSENLGSGTVLNSEPVKGKTR
ncbi:helix-turn-helix domain-containing protein [Phaeobacter piscinae]|uniref:helix-turn-helix domain-containing protein n=1 Tax=Phaeobacter piscinae TaxID=1580596 RepID=UPI000693C38D|nr:helix-turn-helix domain-containing protein [Phaeobacter piscinae]UTS79399.1 hypothetical protein OL67_000446 [Phaeobacter piscinae]